MAKSTQPKVILLSNVAEVIKFFKGDIPDWESNRLKLTREYHDIRVTKELYLRAVELMEIAKHTH